MFELIGLILLFLILVAVVFPGAIRLLFGLLFLLILYGVVVS